MTLKKKALENTVKKEENAGFSSFPTVFSTLSHREVVIFATFNLSSANAFNLVKTKKFVVWKRINKLELEPSLIVIQYPCERFHRNR